MLKEVIGSKIDILLISETLDDRFPLSQFILEGFTPPYRLDRTEHGGGLILFIREDIPSKWLLLLFSLYFTLTFNKFYKRQSQLMST